MFSPREVTRFEAAYNDYLTIGGFPAVQRMVEADRIETLQGYVRDVVARDVAERLGRENHYSRHADSAVFRCAIRPASCLPMVLWKRCERSAGKVYWDKANTLLDLFRQAFLVYQLEELLHHAQAG